MRRSISHWTFRYVRDRLSVMLYERAYPDHPWLTKDAISYLDQMIRPTDVGIEFGSGRSTIWLGYRLAGLISVESDAGWYRRVKDLIAEHDLSGKIDYKECLHAEDYCAQALGVADESLDFCLIDGIARDVCALNVLPKIKQGGLLVIDNINRHLPSLSVSPASRGMADGFETNLWEEFSVRVKDWRRYWTSNGVTDTCIWIKM